MKEVRWNKLLFLAILTLVISGCNLVPSDAPFVQVDDPVMSPAPDTVEANSVTVTLSTADMPDSSIFYTIDGSLPEEFDTWLEEVEQLNEEINMNLGCGEIFYALENTVNEDYDAMLAELGTGVQQGDLTQEDVESCQAFFGSFPDDITVVLSTIITSMDPEVVNSCNKVFLFLDNMIVEDYDSWLTLIGDDVSEQAVQECTALFNDVNESMVNALSTILYVGPFTITQNTTVRAMAHQEGYLPSNIVSGEYLFSGSTTPQCGDNICNGDETYDTCPQDCDDPDDGDDGDGGGSCFLAGTEILLSDYSKKPIEDIKVGESVLSYDVSQDNYVEATVMEVESPVRDDYYIIIFEDESTLKITNEHPLYTNKGWASIIPEATLNDANMYVSKINVGDYVLSSHNDWVKIAKITHVKEQVQTYNLKKVSDTNTFYANGFLAHNKGGGLPPPDDDDDDDDDDTGSSNTNTVTITGSNNNDQSGNDDGNDDSTNPNTDDNQGDGTFDETTTSGGFFKSIWFYAIILVIIGGGIFLFFMFKDKLEDSGSTATAGSATQGQTKLAAINPGIPQQTINQCETYMRKMKLAGKTDAQIREKMGAHGWNNKQLDYLFSKFK